MRWWADNLNQMSLLSSDEGHVVFYPIGPLKGYVVPKRTFHPVIIRSLSRFTVFTLGISLVSMSIGAVLGIGAATLSVVAFIDFVWYSMLVRRLTRNMAPLPFAFAFRFYARCCAEQRLWEQFFCTSFLSLVAFVSLFLGLGFVAAMGMALFGSWSFVCGLLICVRYRESRAVSRKI